MKKYGRQLRSINSLRLSRKKRGNKKKNKKKIKDDIPDYLFSPAVRMDVNGIEIEAWIKRHPTYKEYLNSDAWKKKRLRVLKRDKYKCVHCGMKATQVHHKVYTIWGKEKLKHLDSVCDTCHKNLHEMPEL